LIVSRSISFLERLADQSLYMEGGEVVELGNAETVWNSRRIRDERVSSAGEVISHRYTRINADSANQLSA
jgi:ABC-type molybdate transport system ATPase subunit